MARRLTRGNVEGLAEAGPGVRGALERFLGFVDDLAGESGGG